MYLYFVQIWIRVLAISHFGKEEKYVQTGFGIWICEIFGLLDPDQLVRGTDPDVSTVSSKNSKKNLNFCSLTSLWLFIFEERCQCYLKSVFHTVQVIQ
jgi:desulfoferrodoxin (superoxide reductase-like protein)